MYFRCLSALLLVTCACAGQGAATTVPEEASSELELAYEVALKDARFPRPSEVSSELLALTRDTAGLQWDDEGRVLVYTWTRAKYFTDEKYQPGFSFPLYGETWLSTGNQVHSVCSSGGLSGDALDLRLEQLLGLPPGGDYDAFLAIWVDPKAIFRPCADPSVDTHTCGLSVPLEAKADDGVAWDCAAHEDPHARWLCDSWVDRYSNSTPLQRYPWTALGYTYDWKPGVESHEGVSEFVAPKDTPVVFQALQPTAQFCAP